VRPWAVRIGIGAAVVLLASQLIPIDRSHPAVDPSQSLYSAPAVPKEVRAVLQRSCNDCHSYETSWPWYSYVAPVSWVVSHDVHRGRKAMNFSEWGSYSAKRKEDKLEEICEQLVNGDMPDRKYAFFHRGSRVTQQERSAICQWTEDAREY